MIEINEQPLNDELKKIIYEGFSRHAIAMTGFNEKSDPVSFVANIDGIFAGVVTVELFWGALHIKYLYVSELYRGKKIATQLMKQALIYGLKNDCRFAFVETMSFQALGFYQKMGFELEFSRSGYSHETAFHYLKKNF